MIHSFTSPTTVFRFALSDALRAKKRYGPSDLRARARPEGSETTPSSLDLLKVGIAASNAIRATSADRRQFQAGGEPQAEHHEAAKQGGGSPPAGAFNRSTAVSP